MHQLIIYKLHNLSLKCRLLYPNVYDKCSVDHWLAGISASQRWNWCIMHNKCHVADHFVTFIQRRLTCGTSSLVIFTPRLHYSQPAARHLVNYVFMLRLTTHRGPAVPLLDCRKSGRFSVRCAFASRDPSLLLRSADEVVCFTSIGRHW